MELLKMDIFEAMENRHSVRKYLAKPIPEEIVALLNEEIDACNKESGMNIQLILQEPEALGGIKGKVSTFRNAVNYFAMVGNKEEGLNEKAGYYGERLVLLAQRLGLNTCWIAGSHSRIKCKRFVGEGQKLSCIISVGYGETQGVPHKNKSENERFVTDRVAPEWFEKGKKAVMLAPTAINQQKFRFTLEGNTVFAEETGGFYSDIDLGIVKYHFELGASGGDWKWK